jgi:hypothetical protein
MEASQAIAISWGDRQPAAARSSGGKAMDVGEITESKGDSRRARWIGVYVGVLAALLAVCTLGGDNAAKDATRANIEATNLWGFFQAKNIRRTAYTIAADDLELMARASPAMSSDVRAAIEEKVKAYRDTVARYSTDKASNEGLDELFAKGKEIERERDRALARDPYFDAAQALLQIAIVLASVALITEANLLVWLSAVMAAVGSALMVNGFTLLVKLPFFG